MSLKYLKRIQASKYISADRAYQIIVRPLVTEKSTSLSQNNVFGFVTILEASKTEIQSAIEKIFNVKVSSINTLIQKGKTKKFRGRDGSRSHLKKAFVRLSQGQTLDIGAGF